MGFTLSDTSAEIRIFPGKSNNFWKYALRDLIMKQAVASFLWFLDKLFWNSISIFWYYSWSSEKDNEWYFLKLKTGFIWSIFTNSPYNIVPVVCLMVQLTVLAFAAFKSVRPSIGKSISSFLTSDVHVEICMVFRFRKIF